MDTNITMSLPEVKKYDIIKKVISQELNGSKAAGLLNLTTRHIRRLKKKVDKDGIKALIHGSRGKPGNRRLPAKERKRIAGLQMKYQCGGCRARALIQKGDYLEEDPHCWL